MTELVNDPTANLAERSWAPRRVLRQHLVTCLSKLNMRPFPQGQVWKSTAAAVIDLTRPATRPSRPATHIDRVDLIDQDEALPSSAPLDSRPPPPPPPQLRSARAAVVMSDDEQLPAASGSLALPPPSAAVSAIAAGPDLAPENKSRVLLPVRAVGAKRLFLFLTFLVVCLHF